MSGEGLASVAAGFVGTGSQRRGQGLGWYHNSHCGSRYVTTHDYSRSQCLTSGDLHWWLSEHSAWGTPGLIASIPMVEEGPRAVPTTVYFVSPHNGWQVIPHSTLPGGHLLCPDRWMDKCGQMWYNGILFSHKKEWNNAICSNMDGPRDYHTKWSKSDRERQTSYDITYLWNLKK